MNNETQEFLIKMLAKQVDRVWREFLQTHCADTKAGEDLTMVASALTTSLARFFAGVSKTQSAFEEAVNSTCEQLMDNAKKYNIEDMRKSSTPKDLNEALEELKKVIEEAE